MDTPSARNEANEPDTTADHYGRGLRLQEGKTAVLALRVLTSRGLGLPLAAKHCHLLGQASGWSTPTPPLSAQSSRPITAVTRHAANAPKWE